MSRFGGFPGRGLPGQGVRLRRRVTGTAVAAATMAALTASQAPGAEMDLRTADPGSGRPDDARPDSLTGDGAYHTELPPLESPAPPREPAFGPSQSGIPATLLAAYKAAARSLNGSDPACGLDWQLLAAIGKVESGQARGGAVDREGTTLKPIRGPVLDGKGYARIHDTDDGRLDGDSRYDRAVGPMQFIPSTWHRWSADGNGDGRRDPSNVHDAALAAAGYLCAGERDLATKTGLDRAVLSYNDSAAYLRTVLAWYEFYRSGTHEIPDGTGPLPDSPGAGAGTDLGGGDDGTSEEDGKDDSPGDGEDGDSGKPDPKPGTPATLKTDLTGPLTAYTGGVFEDPARVRVLDTDGKAVQGVRITYEIEGSTGARFPGDAKKATATTGADGRAVAPPLNAGEKAGKFTLTATAAGGSLRSATLDASVEPKYTFAPAPEGPLTSPADSEFPDLAVKLAHEEEPAAGVPVTATLLTADGEEATEGPYFKGLLGNPVPSHTGITGVLGDKGVLTLPAIHTGDRPGTYTLRLTTADGSTSDLELTVTKG